MTAADYCSLEGNNPQKLPVEEVKASSEIKVSSEVKALSEVKASIEREKASSEEKTPSKETIKPKETVTIASKEAVQKSQPEATQGFLFADFDFGIEPPAKKQATAKTKATRVKKQEVETKQTTNSPASSFATSVTATVTATTEIDHAESETITSDAIPETESSAITLLPEFAESPELKGKTVVLTGDFELCIHQKHVPFTREERTKVLKPWIESMGAKVTSSISGKTNIVICGKNPGKQDKIKEEETKGHLIKVLDVDFLNSIIAASEKMEKNTDTHNPLYGRRIAILGSYSLEEEKQIRYEFHKRGAIMNAKKDGRYLLTRTTHYCIIGRNATQEELDKITDFEYDGYYVRRVPIDEYTKLFAKDLGEYATEKDIKRNLKINKKYLSYKRFVPKQSGRNPFYEKEIFIGDDLSGNVDIFSQMIGNIGGYANREFFDDTQMILFSDKTVERLMHEETDDTVTKVEQIYNAATDSLGFFNYSLTTESQILQWISEHCKESGDTVTLDLLHQYTHSIK